MMAKSILMVLGVVLIVAASYTLGILLPPREHSIAVGLMLVIAALLMMYVMKEGSERPPGGGRI